MPKPCYDCVNVHGDDPKDWLNKWPKGAEFRVKFGYNLCDGCYDERVEDLCSGWDEDDR